MNTEQLAAPVLIVNVGLFRSASTWACNVALGLIKLKGSGKIVYSDRSDGLVEAVNSGAEYVVLKTHTPDESLRAVLRFMRPRMLITIRDPLDCVASLIERFQMTFEQAASQVLESSNAVLDVMRYHKSIILKYEDQNARSVLTIRRISKEIGIKISNSEASNIMKALLPGKVKDLIRELEGKGVFDERPPAEQYDKDTHWHPNHVGEGLVGQYRRWLSPDQVETIKYITKDFRHRFHYDRSDDTNYLLPGERQYFSSKAISFCAMGFSGPENWGIWTSGEESILRIPCQCDAGLYYLHVRFKICPAVQMSGSYVTFRNNEKDVLVIENCDLVPTEVLAILPIEIDERHNMELTILCPNLKTPAELSIGSESRRIGVGLLELQLRPSQFPN